LDRDRLAAAPARSAVAPPTRFEGRRQGGFGQFSQSDLAVVKQFDKDANGRLNAAERQAAREFLQSQGRTTPGGRGFRSAGGRAAVDSGPRLTPADVRRYPDAPLYDPTILRTLFVQFDDPDWEAALADFYHTDVDLPATVTVDGRAYRDVGVHFRGNSSYRQVPLGLKHSLTISFDAVDPEQALYGYRTLHLLNANDDPTFLKPVLYGEIARAYIPAPRTNYLRVVINGESWGVYPNVQPFNKDFLRDQFGTTKGARWTVPGSPRARGGLEYLGDDPASYWRLYELKSKEEPKAWASLIRLARVLNTTPLSELESALAPILDVDETLRFLALDNALINNDGYWSRASDYSLYEDPKGRFQIVPHDFNETMNETEGRGFGAGAAPYSVELDPLIGLDDSSKPLRARLLAVPGLRARYLKYVDDIARTSLDWKVLGPIALRYQALIAADVKADTRKLYRFEEFDASGSLKRFAEGRRAYLLNLNTR
jgi:hypothetical protein